VIRRGPALAALGQRALVLVGAPLFLIACTFSYYGQLHRKQGGDTYGTVYTAVALVEQRTIWLDDYVPYIEDRVGEVTYMLTSGPNGHTVTATPTASSALALPAIATFSAAGVESGDFDLWMEAGMLTAALAAAASVALLFLALTHLTTRPKAAVVAATYAWATIMWGTVGQALWQHAGATMALSALLLAVISRRFTLAGAAAGAMVAFRLPTAILALALLPLLGRRISAWARYALGVLPYALALGAYNVVAFGSPLEQGYGTSHARGMLSLDPDRLADGIPGLLVSPGRGLFVYSPVLLFALAGVVLGRRRPLYVWSFLAAAAYIVVAANSPQWHGGESFGPRRIADALPLLAILLVPALDAIWKTRWMWLYGALFAWSMVVQLLATSSWEEGAWFDTHDITRADVWWDVSDNEITAMLGSGGLLPRLVVMVAILVGSIALGAAAHAGWQRLRTPRTA
jgi:hypothetical protein